MECTKIAFLLQLTSDLYLSSLYSDRMQQGRRYRKAGDTETRYRKEGDIGTGYRTDIQRQDN